MNPAINSFLKVVPSLVSAIEQGGLSPNAQEEVIRAAQYYATRNKLSFDGTLKGVIRLAEGAQATLATYVAKTRAANDGVSRTGRALVGTGYQNGQELAN